VEPKPIYSEEWVRRLKTGAEELHPKPSRTMLDIHVRSRSDGAGRSMPALREMKRDEVKALRRWLQAAGEHPLNAYTRRPSSR